MRLQCSLGEVCRRRSGGWVSSRSKRDGPLWQPAPKLHDVGYRRGRRAMLQINHTPYRHRGRFIAVALLRAHHKNTQDP